MGRAGVFLGGVLTLAGCAGPERLRWQPASSDSLSRKSDEAVTRADHGAVATDASSPRTVVSVEVESGPTLGAYIERALEASRSVLAARWNVRAVAQRIPQVVALDDPVMSNTIFPIPAVAPQYSLMGYMPYDALLAQQFPWFGTLRLRGDAASHDLRIALFELAATQLDVVAAVKVAYFDLAFGEKAEAILRENRTLAVDFLAVARQRYRLATATQVDVLRAESAVADLDRELAAAGQGLAEARSELARLLHLPGETPLKAGAPLPLADVPERVEALAQLALANRPELRGRLAAVARDETGVELARKRYYPNVTLGLVYQDMEKRNAVTPLTAAGMPNVGLFVGFNLPVYRKKVAAGVCEARARAAADAMLYEAERDKAQREVTNALTQARVQERTLELLRTTNLPNARKILEATAGEYRQGNVDYLALISAWRDVLQVELQIARVEAELGKALATLERAVGVRLAEVPSRPETAPAPPPGSTPGPFQPEGQPPHIDMPGPEDAPSNGGGTRNG